MSIITVGILLILAIAVLGGYYRGFVSSVLGLIATLASILFAFLIGPVAADIVKSDEKLFTTLLYYTEGSEFVAKTDVELTRSSIDMVSDETLETVFRNADMPNPMGRCVKKNIVNHAFMEDGIFSLGDYFNQTIVCVVIEILSILAVFVLLRLLIALLIRGTDFAYSGFNVLPQYDSLIGAGLGLVQGALILFAAFLVLPIVLTVLPKIYEYLSESALGMFFYKANPFFRMVPSV